MRFTSGWVKVHRSAFDGDLGMNPTLMALWIGLLCMATWKPTKILWQGKQRELQPGSVVFGINELSEKWDCSRSVIRKWLHYLHDTQRIVLETCSRGSLVTICNWAAYQSVDDEACAPSEHGVSTECARRVRGETLSKESKKEELNTGTQEPSENRQEHTPQKAQIKECWDTWVKTLTAFKSWDGRLGMSSEQEVLFYRSIQRWGFARVILALEGKQHEPKSEKYDPAKNLALAKVLNHKDPDKFDRLVNLGQQARLRQSATVGLVANFDKPEPSAAELARELGARA